MQSNGAMLLEAYYAPDMIQGAFHTDQKLMGEQ